MSKQSNQRRRRLCYWDNQQSSTSASKLNIERHLNFLPDFDFLQLSSLEDSDGLPCDLLIVNALSVPHEDFPKWLIRLNKRIQSQNGIWTPALIFSDVTFTELSDNLHDFADENWYFDVINPEHLDSTPIRVANLLKIHDHLHELYRYQEQIDAMNDQIKKIEQKLSQD